MPSDTRQLLIDAARQRFYNDGFRNVGIDIILSDVGISKTAFYKHFESKDDLMVAVLETVGRFLDGRFREMVKQQGGRSARGQLRAMLDVVKQISEQPEYHGCIFVNAVMEFPLPHDPVHQAAARHKKAFEDMVYELGERVGVREPEIFAKELCLILEGLYVTRAVTRDPRSIEIARRLSDQVIERHLGERAENEVV
jgi:AcrR family transcriptional regulator